MPLIITRRVVGFDFFENTRESVLGSLGGNDLEHMQKLFEEANYTCTDARTSIAQALRGMGLKDDQFELVHGDVCETAKVCVYSVSYFASLSVVLSCGLS